MSRSAQESDLFPALATAQFKTDAKRARSLAGKAIHDPTNLKAEEVLALAFALIAMLDTKEPATLSSST